MSTKNKAEDKPKEHEEQGGQSVLIFVVSGGIILASVLCYFLIPDFKAFINDAISILSSDDEQRIEQWVSGFGAWGPAFIILAMVVQMFLIVIPSVVLMVVSTLAYGPWWGSVISYVAVAVASTIAYFIGLKAGQALIDELIGEKSEKKVAHYIQKYGAWAIMAFRVSPFLSNDAISFVAGLGKMGYPKFIGATTVGIIPLIVLIAVLGQDMGTLKTGMLWVSGFTVGAFLIYLFISERKK